jgi:hypothetical protein
LWVAVAPVLAVQEPFEHHHILDVTNEFVWTDMVFSDDDRFIALSCPRGVVLVDAFNLQEVRAAVPAQLVARQC